MAVLRFAALLVVVVVCASVSMCSSPQPLLRPSDEKIGRFRHRPLLDGDDQIGVPRTKKNTRLGRDGRTMILLALLRTYAIGRRLETSQSIVVFLGSLYYNQDINGP